MNDTKKLDVKTCISGLKELILDVLAKAQKPCKMGIKVIRDEAGITAQFEGPEARNWLSPFTRAILLELKYEGYVQKHGHGHGSYWTITEKGLSKLRDR